MPSAPPTDLVAVDILMRNISLQWTSVPEIHQNGFISYNVEYRQSSELDYASIITTTTSVVLTSLQPFTEYMIRVTGSTVIGAGPSTDNIMVYTLEDSKFPSSQICC